MRGEDGQSALEIMPVAGGARRCLTTADEQLELTVALLAGVFVERHV
jgi:hypothetical protein